MEKENLETIKLLIPTHTRFLLWEKWELFTKYGSLLNTFLDNGVINTDRAILKNITNKSIKYLKEFYECLIDTCNSFIEEFRGGIIHYNIDFVSRELTIQVDNSKKDYLLENLQENFIKELNPKNEYIYLLIENII